MLQYFKSKLREQELSGNKRPVDRSEGPARRGLKDHLGDTSTERTYMCAPDSLSERKGNAH